MMIIFVSAHYQILFGLLQAQITYGFCTLASDVDVGEVFARLTVVLLLVLVGQAGK